MSFTADISANDIAKIVKACGEAGVTHFKLNGLEMDLKPRWVADAEVAQAAVTYQVSAPVVHEEQMSFTEQPTEEQSLDDLALTDPVAWNKLGMGHTNE